MYHHKEDALTQFIAAQQRASDLARPDSRELHLHHHHHAAPAPTPEPGTNYRRDLPHPLVAALTMAIVSLAICLPFAFAAAVIEALNKPDVQYIQPGGRW